MVIDSQSNDIFVAYQDIGDEGKANISKFFVGSSDPKIGTLSYQLKKVGPQHIRWLAIQIILAYILIKWQIRFIPN